MPYRRNKDLSNCAAQFKLMIDDYYYLHVYLWKDKQSMYDATYLDPPYGGCYIGMSRMISVDTGLPKKEPPKYGEIHIPMDRIGAGVWAHELMHFMLDWMDLFKLDPLENAEPLCKMAGEITRKFWVKFYGVFKEGE